MKKSSKSKQRGAAKAVAVLVVIGFVAVVIVVLYDAGKSGPAICGINSRILLRDTCEGACLVITSGLTQVGNVLTTRPYMIWATQAATCACANPPGMGGAGTGGAGGGAGGAGNGTGGSTGGSGSGAGRDAGNH